MCEHERKHCPRCNSGFECKVGSILICQCSAVTLSTEERNYIQEQYTDCLCANCLKEMKAAWHKELFKRKLYRISALLFNKNKSG
ncbi:cysteine-rich CWC family protein [Chitinophaga nivalis]|uniref:Cysteine-rich CWC family protein n=2 Tax=Chitinophaga nivalis TaxID=2991709 RepID=A0ABT3IQ46_9BACT|nr:cysteine-rich CWC family protein [Chitinophaga nivalis]MCW3464217.1 cysteine-rich CWC family protein [Chitinophaga nivalis]MCW3486093.1 cysteine-rich CWC family protein [Chitinophaga nivalis]